METVKKNRIRFERAEETSALLHFSCGIKQMDDFIHNKEKGLEKFICLGLSHLWLVYEEEKVIAFFTLSKDALRLNSEDRHMLNLNKKSGSLVGNDEEKFWEQEKYSALEIDYLAVSKERQGEGIGTTIVGTIERYAGEDKLSSTLFLTVEALACKGNYSSTNFYRRCGFEFSEIGKTRNENMERDGVLPQTVMMYKVIPRRNNP